MISSCVDIKCPVDVTKTDLLYSEWLLKAVAVKLEWIRIKTYIKNTKRHLRNEGGWLYSLSNNLEAAHFNITLSRNGKVDAFFMKHHKPATACFSSFTLSKMNFYEYEY